MQTYLYQRPLGVANNAVNNENKVVSLRKACHVSNKKSSLKKNVLSSKLSTAAAVENKANITSKTSDKPSKSKSSSASKDFKVTSKAAYQGVPGAYSEVAASKSCPSLVPLPCDRFEDAFMALIQGKCDRAVLPVENSLGGSIYPVYDLMMKHNLYIVGETSISINHCLVALPGTKKSDLERVMSHPQALSQCDGYLKRLGVHREEVDDTAGAAQTIASEHLKNVGAVCSRRAAELYGLDILDEGIQDNRDNVTRFVVLSRDAPQVAQQDPSKLYKTSVVFSLQPGPGKLSLALSIFSFRNIDLTMIVSRPMRSNPIVQMISEQGQLTAAGARAAAEGRHSFNYLFYVDFIGSTKDRKIVNALRDLEEIAPYMKILGAYPYDTELGVTRSDDPTIAKSLFNGKASE
nr:arogenate/prephenate dehydratase (ADT) [Polytomella parva]